MASGSLLQIYPFSTKPSAPPTGSFILYVKTDDTVYLQDSSGSEFPFASTASITQLTGDVSATGPGVVSATVNFVGGSSAINIHSAELLANAATFLNTPSTIIFRDSSGNFSAGVITAALNGNATTATTAITSTNFTGSLVGDVTGTQSATVVSFVGGKTASDVAAATATVDAATPLNTSSTLVFRDASGNFAANIITASLSGNATTATNAATAVNFTGSLSGDVTGTQSATAISATTVTGKLLTGLVPGTNSVITSSNSILTALENLQAQISATVGSAITDLTGDVSATGPGSVAATVNSVGGSSAANIHSAELAANAATSINTASTIVKRDASGNFAAGTITANLTGLATNATTAVNFTGSLSGDVTGTQSATVVSLVGGSSAANVHSAELLANAATSVNTPSAIVKRDGSGNFSAGTITANITGNVSGTALNVTGIVAIAHGGTNSAVALSNNRVMVSSSGSIVEAPAITANRAIVSDSNGLPIASATTDTEIGYVSGVTSSIQAQINAITGSGITALTGDVSATGPGSVAATVNSVGGSSAANIHSAELAANAATSVNTPSTIVKRDGSGNFSAGTITANLTGLATNATTAVNFTGSLSGDVTGTQSATAISSATVTGKLLTGYVVGANTPIAATDSVLIAFEKVQAQINATTGAAITALTGDGTATGPGSSVFTLATVNSNVGTFASVTVNGKGLVTAASALSGDATTSGATLTLATVNSNVGSFGTASSVSSFTVNAKGLITAASNTSIQIAESQVTNLVSDLAGKQPTGNYITALTGDVSATGPGSVAATIQANVVTNAKLAQMASNTIKGNNTGGTANALDLTVSQVNTMLGTVTTVGSFNGQTASANGAVISSNSIFFQSASTSNPGMVDTTTQSFAGNKTFTGTVAISPSSTSALVINTTSFIFDSTNNAMGIGVQPATNTFVDAVNSSAASKPLQLTGYGTGSTVGTRGRFARGTSGSPTAAQTGDILNFWSARGYGASQFAAASTGVINAIAGENFTNTSNLTYLAFQTTPTASVTSAESMRVASTGVTLGPQTTPTGVHQINGGVNVTRRTITANLTVDTTTTDYLILCNNSGAINITLPAPTDGRVLVIKDIAGTANTNNVTIVRHGSEKIEGLAASFVFQTNWGCLTIYSDGTDWYVN